MFIATNTGLETTAVDISQTALREANKLRSSAYYLRFYAELSFSLLAASQLPSSAIVKFEYKDFFSLGQSEDERFDLIYDYT